MKLLKQLGLLLSIPLALSVAGCLSLDPNKKTVAILMPEKTQQRYVDDSNCIKKNLENYGYNVIQQYASADIEIQVAQLENMISLEVDAILIMAVDSLALVGAEKSAQRAGIPIIAYDRLLMDTDAVDYYYTFDNYQVGQQQGQFIIDNAKLEEVKEAGGHKTIEFFNGSQDDNNSYFFYNGMMDKLKPYLEDKTLICRTGRLTVAETTCDGWLMSNAQENCENYLSAKYPQHDLDIAYCAADQLALGVIAALESAGYSSSNWPLVTGQDAEITNIKQIINGKQTMTIYKDGNVLGKATAEGINNLLSGKQVEVNDTKSYNNNVKMVNTYLCPISTVTKDNYKEILVDTGHYTMEQLGK